MTENNNELTIFDEYQATKHGALDLAAAKLAGGIQRIITLAKDRADLKSSELADRIDVSPGRMSQILNGDGNLRVATIAKVLQASGYELELTANPIRDDLDVIAPPKARSRRQPANQKRGSSWTADIMRATFVKSDGVVCAEYLVPRPYSLNDAVALTDPEFVGSVQIEVKLGSILSGHEPRVIPVESRAGKDQRTRSNA